jgi:hypothetical protein
MNIIPKDINMADVGLRFAESIDEVYSGILSTTIANIKGQSRVFTQTG